MAQQEILTSFENSFKPFFGDSNATADFVFANFEGSNDYDTPLNTKENPSLDGKLIKNIIYAENYNNYKGDSAKDGEMKRGDVHNEFVDFIVRTALFHRSIDKPTGMGPVLGRMYNSFYNAVKTVLSDSNNAGLKTQFDDLNTLIVNTLIVNKETDDVLKQKWKKFIGNCKDDNNLCSTMMKHIYNDSSVKTNIMNIFNRIHWSIGGVQDTPNNVYNIFMTNLSDDLKNSFGQYKINPTKSHDEFAKFIAKIANKNITKLVQNKLNNSYTIHDAIDDVYKKMITNIFGNWTNLAPEAKQFYKSQLNILHKYSENDTVWGDHMSELNKINTISQNQLIDNDNMRFNLTKSTRGAQDTMFEHTLPFLHITNKQKLWYTNNKKILTHIELSNNDTDIFKRIYRCVYNNDSIDIQSNTIHCPLTNLPNAYTSVESKIDGFNLNNIMVIRNYILASQNTTIQEDKSIPLFSDLFKNSSIANPTGVSYKRNAENKLVRVINGVESNDFDNVQEENCAGTMLKPGIGQSNDTCVELVGKCILSGDPKNLSFCLETLQDKNMFNVAQDELQNMNPKIAINILKTFGVRKYSKQDAQFGQIYVPESYENWYINITTNKENNTVNKTLIDAIKSNPKLTAYLQGVIAFITMHPSILNDHIKSTTVSSSIDQLDNKYLNALGKRLYRIPHQSTKEHILFDSAQLRQGIASPLFGVTAGQYMTPFYNAAVYPGMYGVMQGGNAIENSIEMKNRNNELSSGLMTTLMNNVYAELRTAGIVLNDKDQKRIQDGINTLKINEQKMIELYKMMKVLSNLTSFYKSTNCVPTRHVNDFSIDQIRTRGDAIAYLQNNITDLKSCVEANIMQQNNMSSELVKYFSILFDTAAGKPHADIKYMKM